MKYYDTFLKMRSFRFADAVKLTGNERTAKSLLRQYCRKGYIASIKRGLYVAVSIVDKEPVLNRFQIASVLTDTSCVSLHSAFEYYGYSNQVSYAATVCSGEKFNSFDFNGYHYERIAPGISGGVVTRPDGVRVTDVERTVIDGINSFERNMGFEELARCIMAIPMLNEEKLAAYLEEYNKNFLYQKTGFLLEHFRDGLVISEAFLAHCKSRIGKSSRYLLKDRNDAPAFNARWNLTVPEGLWAAIIDGGDEDADL